MQKVRNEIQPQLTFERATAKDAASFLEIEQSIAPSPTYSPTVDISEALSEIESNIVYLIHDGAEVVGSVMYQMKSANHAYISGLAIRSDYQGKGIGKTAMEKVLHEMEAVPTIDLVTHPENKRAIKLYESLGFVVGERIENYFDDGEPRIVMTLKH